MPFQVGQRWISDSESDQGLGTVTGVEHRFVNIVFTATGESRKYAKDNAPLTRVIFNKDDLIPSHEGWSLKVISHSESQGIISYEGIRQDTNEQIVLREVMIDHFIKFNKPHDRLLNSQVDRLDWFRLRKDCLQHQYQQQQSDLTGLTGGRVSVIPHQLYIADEVGNRFAPRVLLADEVGLGKTIEAGLIIHQQLVTGRAKRILIIVPESLMHQWLVEMLRRFNLNFSIFDNERCVETSQDNYVDGKKANPFSSEQLVLVNLGFITNNPEWYEALVSEDWDLMVVDEAHHLNWQQDNPSIEYQCIEQLAQVIPGVLLLTATPDQLGHESHFARLRLLDADRFYDYQKFTEEESHYSEVADAANALVEGNKLSNEQETTLTDLLKEADISSQLANLNQADDEQSAKVRQGLLKQLLDRHGTGRILFRNSRNTIKGFPARQVVPAALEMPEQYQDNINEFMLSDCPEALAKSKQAKYLFTPEMLHGLEQQSETWTDFDPRVDYLIELLQSLKKEKVLVICAHAQTAMDLEAVLRIREGIRSAVFHEGLSIFERDKAAAYFAQDEDSAQLLLCSEIGSEGRNFQFAHHLVLFDLPSNPDLLEQRIGRLDRIGQTEIIRIHVPYFEDSAQQLLFDWYQQGMQAFEQTCITGRVVFETFGEQLLSLALTCQQQSAEAESLISNSWQKHLSIKAELESGRDKLLELNSSGQGRALELVNKIQKVDNDIALPQFMFQALDVFGVQQDDKADNAIALNQSEHMLNSNFPCLPEDGTTVTFDRDTALVNENYQLLTWDHPMVRGVLDLVLSDEIGNASIGLLKNEALPVGTFFLECLFTVEATAPAHLQLGRYLPTTPIRILVDKNGNNLADKVSEQVLDKQLSPVKKQMALQLIKALKSQITPLVAKAEAHGTQHIVAIQEKSLTAMQNKLSSEQQRLTALKAINPSVRQEEIDFISQQQEELTHYIDKAQLTFEAIRMIVVTH
ncbi:RNA polymerase-associated protein RapA [Colwellia psychrerythraea]|uniref:RNA polymerase-associated protein RapA n=1 Tax=Colwellia psychrerythraea TaxID=28229 RepID=A0A099KUP6_COLPS|nr:RNA polymerase-associated protein RapA [Colwellia psychrerythraea]KGJ94256.1 RNA polymerase recycling, bacterial, C-terminal [Colwellia psychrerythraea]